MSNAAADSSARFPVSSASSRVRSSSVVEGTASSSCTYSNRTSIGASRGYERATICTARTELSEPSTGSSTLIIDIFREPCVPSTRPTLRISSLAGFHRSRRNRFRMRRPLPRRKRTVDHRLRLFEDTVEVLLAAEAFGVNLVDILGTRRTRGEPAAVGHHLQAADGSAVARRAIEYAADCLARQIGVAKRVRRKPGETSFLLRRGPRLHAALGRRAQVARDIAVDFARIAPHALRDFHREQRRHDAVLVGGPHAAVDTQEARARTFFAGEAERAVAKALDEPFEAHRDFAYGAIEPCRHAVYHLRADDSLADRGTLAPARPVRKKVVD